MPEKKVNVLSQLLCVFKSKKSAERDIVAMADKVIEDYIFSKNKLIRKKCKNSSGTAMFIAILGVVSGLVILLMNII